MKSKGESEMSAEGSKVDWGHMRDFANVGGHLHAFDDTCTHRGCSLTKGKLDGTTVTCPCHGSQFDVTSGGVLRGPAQRPVRSRLVEVEGEVLLVEA